MATIKKYRCETCGQQIEREEAPTAVSDCCQGRWIEVEKLPACGMPASAEHSRFESDDGPCDDGRSG